LSFGVGAPLASLWLQDAGCSATVIGANTGVYYLSIAVGGIVVPMLMRLWGKRCLLLGMLGSGLTVAAFPWAGGLTGWFLLRVLNGAFGALSLIPTETLVNQNAPPEKRSRDFGFYAFSMALGIALGTCTGMQMYPVLPRAAFVLGGTAALLAFACILGGLRWTEIAAEERSHGPLDFAANFPSFGAAWSQGFLEGGMVSLMPLYLLAAGLSQGSVGWLMSGTMIGVISFQVPIAWLADRLGRTTVLLGCHAVTIAALALVLNGVTVSVLAVCLFLSGACSSAFYPLGLARLGERLPTASLARANAWYLGINSTGSLVGPIVSGMAMDALGSSALIASGLIAVVLVLVVWTAIHGSSRFLQPSTGAQLPVARRRAA
jgi:MFS family permease